MKKPPPAEADGGKFREETPAPLTRRAGGDVPPPVGSQSRR